MFGGLCERIDKTLVSLVGFVMYDSLLMMKQRWCQGAFDYACSRSVTASNTKR